MHTNEGVTYQKKVIVPEESDEDEYASYRGMMVEPVYMTDGSIKCPVCQNIQPQSNEECFLCGVIFQKE